MSANQIRLMVCCAFLSGLALLCSCTRSKTASERPESRDEVLAVVGDRTITRAAFEQELNRRAKLSPWMFSDDEARARLLQAMVDQKAVVALADAEGFSRRPEIVAMMEELIATRFREEGLAKWSEIVPPVTSGDITSYYNANRDDFIVPAAVRAGVILIPVSPKASPDRRHEAAARAEAIRVEAASATDAGFRRLVQQHSGDQSTRYTGGDTGWLEEGASLTHWEPPVIRAAFGLNESERVAPLLETEKGFYILRFTERRPAQVRPLEEVKDGIRYRLGRQRELEIQRRFTEEVRQGLEISINESLLKSISAFNPVQTAAVPTLPGE